MTETSHADATIADLRHFVPYCSTVGTTEAERKEGGRGGGRTRGKALGVFAK